MTFLAPMPAIIAAAVTVPALLALYFLKLRRRPVRVGSTMLWRAAAEDLQANVPFKWLRPSVLLLLQLLILAGLLLALARPAVEVEGGMPSQVFIIVDRSASMRAADMPDGRTRFEEAVALALRAVERVGAGAGRSEVTLIAAGREAEIVAGPTRSAGELRRAIGAMEPTDEPGDLGPALRLVQALSAPEDPEAEARALPLVVVCSDGRSAGELPALPAEVVFRRAAPGAPGENIGVVAFAARRDHGAPETVRLFARLVSTLGSRETVGVSVALDGEVLARRAVEVAPAGEGGPGETPLAMEVGVPGGGLVTLTVERGDVLASDDSASLVLAEPRRPAVLLVREREDEGSGSGWLLTDVLRELDLSGLTLMSAERARVLGPDAYVGIDLAVFDGVAAPGVAPVASVHFGRPAGVPGVAAAPGAGGVLPVLAWARSDPLLRDISLDAVRVGRGELLSAGEGEGSFVELARTAEGVVLASVEVGGVRRVVSGFDLVQSTWPVDYSFPIFLANVVESLPRAGALAAGWGATTGEPASPPWAVGEGEVLTDPRGGSREVRASASGEVRLGVLGLAGVWR
ncbi:MAG: VWA domain-containing protein, partial [Phycisphaerales bacterium]|nr:VWA domain-containing protein [Phycisphaerales bacterium]